MAPHTISRALRRLLDRRLISALSWGLALILVAAAINVIGIRVVGDVNGWAQWLRAHRADFLVWRIGLYGATAWGWWRMRERLRRREPDAPARLRRLEIAAVVVIAALEILTFGPS